jgi:hypothetical protein
MCQQQLSRSLCIRYGAALQAPLPAAAPAYEKTAAPHTSFTMRHHVSATAAVTPPPAAAGAALQAPVPAAAPAYKDTAAQHTSIIMRHHVSATAAVTPLPAAAGAALQAPWPAAAPAYMDTAAQHASIIMCQQQLSRSLCIRYGAGLRTPEPAAAPAHSSGNNMYAISSSRTQAQLRQYVVAESNTLGQSTAPEKLPATAYDNHPGSKSYGHTGLHRTCCLYCFLSLMARAARSSARAAAACTSCSCSCNCASGVALCAARYSVNWAC